MSRQSSETPLWPLQYPEMTACLPLFRRKMDLTFLCIGPRPQGLAKKALARKPGGDTLNPGLPALPWMRKCGVLQIRTDWEVYCLLILAPGTTYSCLSAWAPHQWGRHTVAPVSRCCWKDRSWQVFRTWCLAYTKHSVHVSYPDYYSSPDRPYAHSDHAGKIVLVPVSHRS